MKKKGLILVLVALVTVGGSYAFFLPEESNCLTCNGYYGHTPSYFPNFGWACAYWGPNCVECYNGSYQVCVEEYVCFP